MMDSYEILDMTKKAHELAGEIGELSQQNLLKLDLQVNRKPTTKMISGQRGRHDFKFDVKELSVISYGEHRIQMDRVEQLMDKGQSRAIAWIIHYYATHLYSKMGMVPAIEEVLTKIKTSDLDSVTEYKIGNLALPRKYEILAAINRIREDN